MWGGRKREREEREKSACTRERESERKRFGSSFYMSFPPPGPALCKLGLARRNLGLRDAEKRQELEKLIPRPILVDYDDWHFPIEQMMRLKRHPWAYKLVWLLERVLFKFEKRKTRK